jgi:hypothetical protein
MLGAAMLTMADAAKAYLRRVGPNHSEALERTKDIVPLRASH